MSRQINFYAAPEDTERIHQWLLAEFPGLTLVSQRRGPREHTVPIDASLPRAFWHYPVSLLVPVWFKPLLRIEDLGERFPGEFIINALDNPVIEYRPGEWDESQKIAIPTRFYWAYKGPLPVEAIRQVNKLFRWVQKNTITAESMSFRFFLVAARTARFVRQDLKSPLRANPLFQEKQSVSTETESVDKG